MLNEHQLAWCRKELRSFAPAENNWRKADESKMESYRKLGCEPGEVVGVYIESCATNTALQRFAHLKPGLAAKIVAAIPRARA